jgi:hypothetical protein
MGSNQSKTEALEALQQFARASAELAGERVPLLIRAREAGASWTDCGRALGLTKQACQAAYAKWKREAYEWPLPDDQDPMFTA